MMTQATLGGDGNGCGQVLYMALELSSQTWKVLFAAPAGRRREVTVAAREMGQLLAEVAAAKAKLKLAADAPVVSCYEAGRDGFWLDRALRLAGIANSVVDSASIEVPQHARRCKTDHVDLGKLMDLLLRRAGGEAGALKSVRVPEPESEDVRQLSRGIERLKGEHGRHVARITSLLATQGLVLARIGEEQPKQLNRCSGTGELGHRRDPYDVAAEGYRNLDQCSVTTDAEVMPRKVHSVIGPVLKAHQREVGLVANLDFEVVCHDRRPNVIDDDNGPSERF